VEDDMTRTLMTGAAAAAVLAIAGCAQPYPQYAYQSPQAYPAPVASGGAMSSPAPVAAMQPIPDTPDNRARYGGPQSRAGKRSAYERPY
jgi:hypothetical protein